MNPQSGHLVSLIASFAALACSQPQYDLRRPFEESGDFAVEYELRAWTDRADIMHITSSSLRRNVLDAFNTAGIEIMTPNILAHRDASALAVPEERFPHRDSPRGIVVDVNRSSPNR